MLYMSVGTSSFLLPHRFCGTAFILLFFLSLLGLFITAAQFHIPSYCIEYISILKMHASLPLFLNLAALALAKPIEVRTVAALNTAAFEAAQQRDNTATRAFSNTEIKVSSTWQKVEGDADW
jgi:hypothetical protein